MTDEGTFETRRGKLIAVAETVGDVMVERGRAITGELAAPDGTTWSWGTSATDAVRGPARDFCLVVTRRRHPDDTTLAITGARAAQWMEIAQAFAGLPADQRPRRAEVG